MPVIRTVSYRSRRRSALVGRLEMTAGALFLPWLGAYVTGFTFGGAIHFVLLAAGLFLTSHFHHKNSASLLAMAPGEILDLHLGTSARPAAYRLLVTQERARRASVVRRPRSGVA